MMVIGDYMDTWLGKFAGRDRVRVSDPREKEEIRAREQEAAQRVRRLEIQIEVWRRRGDDRNRSS